MKRSHLVFLAIIITSGIMLTIALHSDFSALHNTDLALVNRISIYDLPEVEALAQ